MLLTLGAAATAWALVHPPRRTPADAIARGRPADPSEVDPPDFTTRVAGSAEGRPLELWVLSGDRPDGPLVVVVHGWGDSRYGALAWYEPLRESVSHAVFFDLRAHGESPHRRSTWGLEESGDLRRVVDSLKERWPAHPFVLLGLSMGAVPAVLAARDGLAARVILDSPVRRPIDCVRRTLHRNGLPSWPLAELAFAGLSVRWPRLVTMDLAAMAKHVRVPVDVISCDDDGVAPLSDAWAIAEALPDGRLHRFGDAGHLAAACREPLRYGRIVSGVGRAADATP